MLLKLSIELTSARGRTFNTELYRNAKVQGIVTGDVAIDVVECDVIRIRAVGKGDGTVVSPSGNITEDISLKIKKVLLSDVEIADHYKLMEVTDLQGIPLDTLASLYCDGEIVIKISDLVYACYTYAGVPMLTIEQVIDEILGSEYTNIY